MQERLTCYLLRRHVEVLDPEVDLLVDVDTGDDEEDPRAPRPAGQEAAKPEYYCTLVLLPEGSYKYSCQRGATSTQVLRVQFIFAGKFKKSEMLYITWFDVVGVIPFIRVV